MIKIKLQASQTDRIRIEMGRAGVYLKRDCVGTTLNHLSAHLSRKNEKVEQERTNLKLKRTV